MIYEIRTYTLNPGCVGAFEKLFESSLKSRINVATLAAFWHTGLGTSDQAICVLSHDNFQQIDSALDQLEDEQEWIRERSDLIRSMHAGIFRPAPFSPQLGGNQKLGNIYEMRIYEFQRRSIPTVLERWQEALKGGRLELSPIAACMLSEIGDLNIWIHIWPYKSMAERDRIRNEAKKLDTWPPKTLEFIVHQQNKILLPASFSPMA